MNARQPRQTTFLSARMRSDGGWHDAIIRNVSAKGAMLQLDGVAPPTGSFIELRRATSVIVAQVRWAAADCCGIRTRETIDIDALKAGAALNAVLSNERRLLKRDAHHMDFAIIGRWLQHGGIALLVLIAAVTLCGIAYNLLATTSHNISYAMSDVH